jgi:LysR family hydrogen peroxide-inducible transcriptional activator
VLREEQTARLVRQLEAGGLDVALLALPVEEADLVETPLYEEAFLFVAPRDHPLARDPSPRIPERALKGEEVLLLEDGHCLRAQALDVCRRAGAVAKRRIQATSLPTLVQMVAGGLGVTLVPERARPVEAHAGTALVVKEFSRPAPSRTIGLAWRRGAAREAEYRLLARTLAHAAALPRPARSPQAGRSQRASAASKAAT